MYHMSLHVYIETKQSVSLGPLIIKQEKSVVWTLCPTTILLVIHACTMYSVRQDFVSHAQILVSHCLIGQLLHVHCICSSASLIYLKVHVHPNGYYRHCKLVVKCEMTYLIQCSVRFGSESKGTVLRKQPTCI